MFRPGYNVSRTCTQGGSWVAVDVTSCRISKLPLILLHNGLSCFSQTVDQPATTFTLYLRFSSLLREILTDQNLQGALLNIENVVCVFDFNKLRRALPAARYDDVYYHQSKESDVVV